MVRVFLSSLIEKATQTMTRIVTMVRVKVTVCVKKRSAALKIAANLLRS